MKALSAIVALLLTVISLPIWYYVMYQVLVRVGASELMMFLFWVYIPLNILTNIFARLVQSKS